MTYSYEDESGGSGGNTSFSTTEAVMSLNANQDRAVRISGYIRSHATLSSTVEFQWAQDVDDGSTLMIEGSTLDFFDRGDLP